MYIYKQIFKYIYLYKQIHTYLQLQSSPLSIDLAALHMF